MALMCASFALFFSPADAAQERETTIYEYCMPGPFVLTFKDDAAALGKMNKAILDNVLSHSAHCGKFVAIDGYPTVSGSKIRGYTRSTLALHYLVEHGISSTDIHLRLHDRRSAIELQDHRWDVAITFVDGDTDPWGGG